MSLTRMSDSLTYLPRISRYLPREKALVKNGQLMPDKR